MHTHRRFVLNIALAGAATAASGEVTEASVEAALDGSRTIGPDAVYEKPAPTTMDELASKRTLGVSAVEVNDYVPGNYTGALHPTPPHADMNPKKGVVVFWKDSPCRFVFSHEASYIPFLQLPDGTAMCNNYFGGPNDSDLMYVTGRREKNNFVDIVESGPQRVWVRWNYLSLSKNGDSQPRFRGTEDYFAFPNGLLLRRIAFNSLMPNSPLGYPNMAVDLFGMLPPHLKFSDCFARDSKVGDYNVLSMLDLYGGQRYDLYSDNEGRTRRVGSVDKGDDDILGSLGHTPGSALVIPFRGRLLFAVLGTASGFDPKNNQFLDWSVGLPSEKPTPLILDHWPIGWSNYLDTGDRNSPYTKHFGNLFQAFVPTGKRARSWNELRAFAKDMDLNRWLEKRVFYVLLGSAREWDEIIRIGRTWLENGANCARSDSVANIRTS